MSTTVRCVHVAIQEQLALYTDSGFCDVTLMYVQLPFEDPCTELHKLYGAPLHCPSETATQALFDEHAICAELIVP